MVTWRGYNGNVYTASQLAEAFEEAFTDDVEIVTKGKTEYYNIPCSFDIETTSFTAKNSDGEDIKCATMYIWQMGLNGTIIYGRTWGEFLVLIDKLYDYLQLKSNRRIIIYVHNLAYEFQFIRKMFRWDKVFSLKQRRPIYAISNGLEFRCSYILSNYALAYIGDNLLHKYPVKKLVGDLDYTLKRNCLTPLTEKELDYCINDVRVVMSYIQEKIEQDGDITKIPLTNTGYVRNFCRKECFFEGIPEEDKEARHRVQMNYRAIMKSLIVQSEDEYNQLHRAFAGGFTHASCLYSGKVMYDVGSADLTSSYPYTIVGQYFPMTRGEYIGEVESDKLLTYYLSKFCCLFDIQFTNLRPQLEFENYLSESHCVIDGARTINNGRVVSADVCTTTITELDFDVIKKFYTWDSIKVYNMRVYHRGYLPKALILSVLELYGNKTSLKGVIGKEVEYLCSKGMVNAAFGMMVTAIVRDDYEYIDEWKKLPTDAASQLAEYNKGFNRFLFYGWGVWVTAHARHNLFDAIYEFGNDYIYSDTDSIKGINFQDHQGFFKQYNQQVLESLLNMCNYYDIPFEKCRPKTIKGEPKLIGVWDIERPYVRFKTVGAKRYLYEYDDGSINLTVSGLNKKYAIPYLKSKFNNNYDAIFEYFGDCMFIPAGHTGKMTLTYIEDEQGGKLVDYQGNEASWHELSSVHMEPQSYFMSLIADYQKFLEGVQYVEI